MEDNTIQGIKPKEKVKKRNNPNGANQFKVDPRQALFLSYYLDRKSKTFANCQQSALKAGFSSEYAKVLVAQMPTWLSDKLNTDELVRTAEKNVKEIMNLDIIEDKIGAFGPIIDKKTKKRVKCVNTGVLKVKANMTQFALKGLSKEKWSERVEHTGKDGGEITARIIQTPKPYDIGPDGYSKPGEITDHRGAGMETERRTTDSGPID